MHQMLTRRWIKSSPFTTAPVKGTSKEAVYHYTVNGRKLALYNMQHHDSRIYNHIFSDSIQDSKAGQEY